MALVVGDRRCNGSEFSSARRAVGVTMKRASPEDWDVHRSPAGALGEEVTMYLPGANDGDGDGDGRGGARLGIFARRVSVESEGRFGGETLDLGPWTLDLGNFITDTVLVLSRRRRAGSEQAPYLTQTPAQARRGSPAPFPAEPRDKLGRGDCRLQRSRDKASSAKVGEMAGSSSSSSGTPMGLPVHYATTGATVGSLSLI
ncbi:hypothetical protein K490DRAFT_58722 [Saccharata proteae CBS 121410]|uniref:Uncharacterized protein n=1 Tax=Saccharata proteae CBS 121410 TaxID=1314787 RepID=A0A9P4HU43_9PEZI|nr:hypothetical protein K490DRAFT_58722 [Saccharata proteae CBS 121410]